MSKATDSNRDNAPLGKKIQDLYALIDGIEIAMFTTRRPDGHLVSRPMATQTQAEGTDLWFVTDSDAHKLDELLMDPHVNCAYFNNKSREWVSVSGVARVSRDRKKIHQLYQPDWKMWFGNEGGNRDGGPDDPRLTLILVEADSVATAYLVAGAIPAPDWSQRVLDAHAEGFAAVGGSIETRDRSLRPWAPGGGRNPAFSHPLLLPSLLDGLEPGEHHGLPAYDPGSVSNREPAIFDGRIRLRLPRGRRRG